MITEVEKDYELKNNFIIQSLSDIKEGMKDQLHVIEKEKTKSIKEIHFYKKAISICISLTALSSGAGIAVILTYPICNIVFFISPIAIFTTCSIMYILEVKEKIQHLNILNEKKVDLLGNIVQLNHLITNTKKQINDALSEVLDSLYNLNLRFSASPKLSPFIFKKERKIEIQSSFSSPKRLDHRCKEILRDKLIYDKLDLLNHRVNKEILNKEKVPKVPFRKKKHHYFLSKK